MYLCILIYKYVYIYMFTHTDIGDEKVHTLTAANQAGAQHLHILQQDARRHLQIAQEVGMCVCV